MKDGEVRIEVTGPIELPRKEILDFWTGRISSRLKEIAPSKKDRLEILEQILKEIS